MRVRFKNPLRIEPPVLQVLQQLPDRLVAQASAGRIEVEHRIDHRRRARGRVADHVAPGRSRRMEERGDIGRHGNRSGKFRRTILCFANQANHGIIIR
jgi:hypothetical protein